MTKYNPMAFGLRDEIPKRIQKITPDEWKEIRVAFPWTHFTIEEAAELLRISISGVHRYCEEQRLKSEKFGQ